MLVQEVEKVPSQAGLLRKAEADAHRKVAIQVSNATVEHVTCKLARHKMFVLRLFFLDLTVCWPPVDPKDYKCN